MGPTKSKMLASVEVSNKAREQAAGVLDEVLPPVDQPNFTSQDGGFTMSNEEIDRAAQTPM